MKTRREAVATPGAIATGSIVAGAGVLAAGPAAAAAAAPELTDEQQLEACISELRTILTRMHPRASLVHLHWLESRGDGSFRFSMQGDVSFQSFQGDGLYLISFHGELVPALVREEPVFYVSGKPTGWSWYNAILCWDGDWESEPRKKISPNFVRKIATPDEIMAVLQSELDGSLYFDPADDFDEVGVEHGDALIKSFLEGGAA